MLYMILKRYADFKTGMFSHPSTKKVNLSFLAGLMTRDARQGKAEKKYRTPKSGADRPVDLRSGRRPRAGRRQDADHAPAARRQRRRRAGKVVRKPRGKRPEVRRLPGKSSGWRKRRSTQRVRRVDAPENAISHEWICRRAAMVRCPAGKEYRVRYRINAYSVLFWVEDVEQGRKYDRPFVEVVVDVVRRGANQFHALVVGLVVRLGALETRQQRVMNVDRLAVELAAQLR